MLLTGVSSQKNDEGNVKLFDEAGNVYALMYVHEEEHQTVYLIKVVKKNGQSTH